MVWIDRVDSVMMDDFFFFRSFVGSLHAGRFPCALVCLHVT